MTDKKIRHIGIIGTGVIGMSWATYFLMKGFQVTASDPAAGAERKLREGISTNDPGLSQDLLHFEKDLEKAVRDVQFVQENGPERLDIKRVLFKSLDAATKPDVLLVSSSSGIAVSDFQDTAEHPERILLGHPFNPPHLIPLVEVCGGRMTSAASIDTAIAFYEAIGKKAIRLRREIPGHVGNRLQAALWQEAFYLVKEGIASAEDVDLAISHGPGLRWAFLGPLLNLHLSGGDGGIRHALEHLGGPMKTWMNDLGKVEITDELIDLLTGEVAKEIHGRSLTKIVQSRNELLTSLIALKKESVDLP